MYALKLRLYSCWQRWVLSVSLGLCLAGVSPALLAQELLAVPVLSSQVIDQTGTLDSQERQALTAQLTDVERRLGTQVVILMVSSVQPEDITSYAQRVGEAWKIGRRTQGDGVLIVVAKHDRKMRIAVAKNLEGALPDTAIEHIISAELAPRFKQNAYSAGLSQATSALAERIEKQEGLATDAPPKARANAQPSGWVFGGSFWLFAVPLALVFFALARRRGPIALNAPNSNRPAYARGYDARSGGLLDVASVILSTLAAGRSGSWGGGGGSSGGGDGFSSGGGGDFGGGGASGEW
jgi:uncharacterized protein